MYKVVTVIGTRPEIIKLSNTLTELDKYTNHIIVHTGQNYDYELNEIFFKDLGLRKPDYFLNVENTSSIVAISQILEKIDKVLEKEKPDAFLIYGDTNSCLSVIAAKKRKIPIFHMEAGNRCFDERVPEEVNRKVVDHLSDINITLSEHARRYLIAEGIKAERIIKLGSSMKEVLNDNKDKINNSNVLNKLNLTKGDYFVVSIHREENLDIDNNFEKLIESLNNIASTFNKKIIFSVHPRTRKKIDKLNGTLKIDGRIEMLKPLGFIDYISLQKNAFCTISDSGTITEESSILGFPAVTIRNNHERPEGMDEGTVIMTGVDSDCIISSINIVTGQFNDTKTNPIHIVQDYDIDNVSIKMVRIINSYIGYVNREIWKKH